MKALYRINIYDVPSQFYYMTTYDTKKKFGFYPVMSRFPKLGALNLIYPILHDGDMS